MTDTETSANFAAASVVTATTQKTESWFEKLEDAIKADIQKLELFFNADVWPYVKEFLSLLASQAGQAALAAAVADVGDLISGDYAPVISAVTGAAVAAAEANANADAQKALQDAQTAGADAVGNPIPATTTDPDGVTTVASSNPNA